MQYLLAIRQTSALVVSFKYHSSDGSGILWGWKEKDIRRYLGQECQTCHTLGTGLNPLTLQHIVPKWMDGHTTYGNVKVLCQRCHKKEDSPYSFAQINNPEYRLGLAQLSLHEEIWRISNKYAFHYEVFVKRNEVLNLAYDLNYNGQVRRFLKRALSFLYENPMP